jgi:hypothetical protein
MTIPMFSVAGLGEEIWRFGRFFMFLLFGRYFHVFRPCPRVPNILGQVK